MTAYRYKKTLRATQREKRFVNDTNCQSVLVLFEGKSIAEMNMFAEDVRSIFPNKKVTICGFIDKIKKEERDKRIHFDRLLTRKGLTLFRNPQAEDIAWASSLECDLLVNLEASSNNALEILTAASTAHMKCGRNITTRTHLFDFIIDLPATVPSIELLQQIVKYSNAAQPKQ